MRLKHPRKAGQILLRRKLLIATGALALTVPTIAYAETGVDRFDDAPAKTAIKSSVVPGYVDKDSKVTVMVELSGDPVAVVQANTEGVLSSARVTQIRSGLKKSQDRVKAQIKTRGGKVLSQMQSAYNGMRVTMPRSQVRAVSQLDGVKSVTAAPIHTIDNAVSVPFLGVPEVWKNTGFLGQGVKVAIIDTGIDYTHADFGGAGTVDAFNAAKASSTFAGTARVKGGYDFAGDAYDASVPGSVPVPDANPLDCNGHGSHVAGTTGGGGVNADGTPYRGPYNKSIYPGTFKVGPGVAPKVDLYALKVFGCNGSTDVVTEAIDWAVANKMNVINMSLGSSYGGADDSDSIAAQNATAAGVVVVASAGNSGPNPYITGSPGAGRGVISVAAVDSTATFAGAKLSFDGKTMDAINANGATLPAGPYEIVYVSDDPATGENEALGCSPAAYTSAGVSASAGAPLQIAVVTRGDCARASKGIYGQQAGADAVIMVNNATSYPPFEGKVTSNPDTGDPFALTIPFLGVRSTDGAALKAADGKSLTLAAGTLNNPAFRAYASFSSGGPRNGDSGLKPSISAPGVSISSAAVGTGSGAEVLSGTSMAAPHVAGVAALARQAHKGWTAQEISAALVSTADSNKVAGYRLTLGGGLVDTAQVVKTKVFAVGDEYRTKAGKVSEATLSFGFSEPSRKYTGVKKLTLVNKGKSRAIFVLSNDKTAQSRPAKVSFSRKIVVVPGKSKRSVYVTLRVNAATVGTSLSTTDQFGFKEVSGNIKIATNGKGTLRVPYLLVPRAGSKVAASQKSVKSPYVSPDVKVNSDSKASPNASTKTPAAMYADVKLTNVKGANAAIADFYTWGLYDRRADSTLGGGRGFDLRAAGVQSFADGDDQLLVFAVNSWTRWSNAATSEFDVVIDVNNDDDPDFIVFSYDSGSVRADDPNGVTEVFVYDISSGALSASGFNATAPTDSSTILLPVYASQLGITGSFQYSGASYSSLDTSKSDQFTGVAAYDPFHQAISNGAYETVPVNGKKTVRLTIDSTQVAAQKPLGTMVVVFDNKSGQDEALLLNKP